MKQHLVFVYGTLRLNENNHHFLKQAELVAKKCWIYGKLYDVGCGYPAVTTGDNQTRVYGELYKVTDQELAQLDILEDYEENGNNNEYERIEQTVFTETGTFSAYVYIYSKEQVSGLREISSGDWTSN
ncbi:gamma-glutamylcyclotransferase family protein [Aquibacillus albus]|uniref:Gamma-glutamylcyclotransferase family protein n=1 Tax=Aquibacillus albus TaxID=1168171 RepID=A0ABS2N5G2_9BACI|nr:gamma-glutamylcyclotransferase family protein [Aquibacillus albus]MBM7573359.1 gamma-glutamylcyclotransferase (GGCT)/AIG2-like uncharacterized protein YtfP [Aquibacillus albus]